MKAKTMMRLLLVPPVVFILVTVSFVPLLFTDDLVVGVLGVLFFGFYGVSLSCIGAFMRRSTLRVARIAEGTGTVKLSTLAQNAGCDVETARTRAAWCISHGYLTDRLISGDTLVCTTERSEHAMKCTYCGASFTYEGDVGRCPYCGRYYQDGKQTDL